jgi:hypothetical protein
VFEVVMKNMREGIGDQVVPKNYPTCTCTDRIQEREWYTWLNLWYTRLNLWYTWLNGAGSKDLRVDRSTKLF